MLIFHGTSCTFWRLGLTVILRRHAGALCVKGRASMKGMFMKWGRWRAQVKDCTPHATLCIIVIVHITTCNWWARCGQITEVLWFGCRKWTGQLWLKPVIKSVIGVMLYSVCQLNSVAHPETHDDSKFQVSSDEALNLQAVCQKEACRQIRITQTDPATSSCHTLILLISALWGQMRLKIT